MGLSEGAEIMYGLDTRRLLTSEERMISYPYN